jgi:hypothetical protein
MYKMLRKLERTVIQTVEIEKGQNEPRVKKTFLHLSHVIMEHNISIRMCLTSKYKLRDYIGQFES